MWLEDSSSQISLCLIPSLPTHLPSWQVALTFLCLSFPISNKEQTTPRLLEGPAKVMNVSILYPLWLNYLIIVIVITNIIIIIIFPPFSALQLPQLMESRFPLKCTKQLLPRTFPAWVLQQPTELSCLEPESCPSLERAVTCPFSSIISERLSAPAVSLRCPSGFSIMSGGRPTGSASSFSGPGSPANRTSATLLNVKLYLQAKPTNLNGTHSSCPQVMGSEYSKGLEQ